MILKKKEMSVIDFARRRLNEAIRQNEDDYVVRYWRAYLDGAESQKKEDEQKWQQGISG